MNNELILALVAIGAFMTFGATLNYLDTGKCTKILPGYAGRFWFNVLLCTVIFTGITAVGLFDK